MMNLIMELESLESELNDVKNRNEEFLPNYGFSSKEEILQLIEEDIEELKCKIDIETQDYTSEELEQERTQLCLSLGISRYC